MLDGRPIEQWVIGAHATPNSWVATYTPRRRNAAGAWTNVSTRAARVLNGNHNRRSDLDSTHERAPRPSLAARCSASAARNTSQRSSPVPGGSASNRPHRVSSGSQRYSSKNSAINRHRRDSSAPAGRAPSRAKLSGRYAWPRPRSSTLTTVVHSITTGPGKLRSWWARSGDQGCVGQQAAPSVLGVVGEPGPDTHDEQRGVAEAAGDEVLPGVAGAEEFAGIGVGDRTCVGCSTGNGTLVWTPCCRCARRTLPGPGSKPCPTSSRGEPATRTSPRPGPATPRSQ